jgi:hypothetical protein
MATYKEIHGTVIETVTSDPPAPVNGQVWYNSTDQVMKGFTSNPVGSWSTGVSINTARGVGEGAGNKTAALIFGGKTPPGASQDITESWDGSSWTEVNDLNTERDSAGGAGTSTSALAFGGENTAFINNTESWNGTSWTEVNDLNTTRGVSGGNAGADNTSALAFGGRTPPNTRVTVTESWDGSSWTEVNDLNTARTGLGGAGIVTAALAYGGGLPSNTAVTESWNGTSWTEVNDLNTARDEGGANGEYTSALYYGGPSSTPHLGNTESWNGTSWSETGDLSTGRYGILPAAQGSNTGALAAGGYSGGYITNTEEFTAPTTSTVTFTAS